MVSTLASLHLQKRYVGVPQHWPVVTPPDLAMHVVWHCILKSLQLPAAAAADTPASTRKDRHISSPIIFIGEHIIEAHLEGKNLSKLGGY